MTHLKSLTKSLGFIFIMVFPLNSSIAQRRTITDLERAKKLIKERVERVDLNVKDTWGRTHLHRAAMGGNTDAVKALLARGADRNLKDIYGKRPVAYALNNEIVSILGKDKFVELSEKAFNNRVKVTSSFNYSKLWPEDVSVLCIGEPRHFVPRFIAEVTKLIRDFKKAGVGLTHYATEFIIKRDQSKMDVYQFTPLPREKFSRYLRLGNYTAEIDKIAKESKVKIIGLDIRDMEMEWKEFIRQKNRLWVDILMGILKKKPKAKILVYGGSGHFAYDFDIKPQVSVLLKNRGVKVKVVTLIGVQAFGQYGPANGYTAKRMGILHEHFVAPNPEGKFKLSEEDAKLVGTDFIINVPEPDTIPEELLRPITSPFIDYKSK